jgi:hypothetical protein
LSAWRYDPIRTQPPSGLQLISGRHEHAFAPRFELTSMPPQQRVIPTTSPAGRSELFFLIGCAIFYAAAVILTPRYFPLLDSDSAGYIEFSIYRTAIYPLFLRLLMGAGLSFEQIAVVQVLLFAGTLIVLGAALLRAGISRALIVLVVIALAANGYFSGLHRAIMAESLFFSVLTIAIAFFIDHLRSGRISALAFATVCLGIAIGIRPAGLFFLPIVPVAAWLKWHQRNVSAWVFAATVLASLATGPIVERVAYRMEHGARQGSIVSLLLCGKAAMLIRPDTEFTGPHAETLKSLGAALYESYGPVQDYLSKVPSWAAWPPMTANYEATAQSCQAITGDLVEWSKQTGVAAAALNDELSKQTILHNLSGYVRLALTHYIGEWSIAGLTFPPAALTVNRYSAAYAQIPLQSMIDKTTAYPPATLRSYIVYPGFVTAGVVTFGLSLLLIAFIVRPHLGDRGRLQYLMVACFLAAAAQIYSFAIGFTNISSTRFMMAVYPHIVLSAVFLLLALAPRLATARSAP